MPVAEVGKYVEDLRKLCLVSPAYDYSVILAAALESTPFSGVAPDNRAVHDGKLLPTAFLRQVYLVQPRNPFCHVGNLIIEHREER